MEGAGEVELDARPQVCPNSPYPLPLTLSTLFNPLSSNSFKPALVP